MEFKQWSPLLLSNENKKKLVDFVVKQWISNSRVIGDKILIEAYKIKINNCMLIPKLESNHKEADTNVSMIVLPKIYLSVFPKNRYKIT